MSKDKANKQEQAWRYWLNGISASAQASLTPTVTELELVSEQRIEYQVWKDSVSPRQRDELQALVSLVAPEEDEIKADPKVYRFGLVECADGDAPLVRLFRSAEALVKHVSSLSGDDVFVWAFYGLPLPFTVGPQRYLLLPGGTHAISVPSSGNPIRKVEVDVLGLDLDDEVFLGPIELVTSSMAEKLTALAAPKKEVVKNKDDDNEELDGEGKGVPRIK